MSHAASNPHAVVAAAPLAALFLGLAYLTEGGIKGGTPGKHTALARRVVFGSLAFYGLMRLWLDR